MFGRYKLEILQVLFLMMAISSYFLPYATVQAGELIKDSTREVFFASTFYWHQNPAIYFVLGLLTLVLLSSFAISNWINKARVMVLSLFAIGLIIFISIGIKIGNHGPIPEIAIGYYVLIFSSIMVIVISNIKIWIKPIKE